MSFTCKKRNQHRFSDSKEENLKYSNYHRCYSEYFSLKTKLLTATFADHKMIRCIKLRMGPSFGHCQKHVKSSLPIQLLFPAFIQEMDLNILYSAFK